MGDVVSAIALAGRDRLLIALRDRLAYFNIQTGELSNLCKIQFPHPDDTRLNDGKCDSQGRFWIGSLSDTAGQAALYRYDPDGSLHRMETELTISNGLGWSPDETTFYLTDSAQHQIFAYDFDRETGSIRNRRVVVDLSHEAVEPDGLAIDVEGNLWSALWDGGCIACFDRSGNERFRVEMPVSRPTCVTFGGQDLTDLYVTSASIGLDPKATQPSYTAGDLFRVSTKFMGIATHVFGKCDRD